MHSDPATLPGFYLGSGDPSSGPPYQLSISPAPELEVFSAGTPLEVFFLLGHIIKMTWEGAAFWSTGSIPHGETMHPRVVDKLGNIGFNLCNHLSNALQAPDWRKKKDQVWEYSCNVLKYLKNHGRSVCVRVGV